MYGICGENDYGKATCSYNGSAIALEDENALEILQEICPHVIRGKFCFSKCFLNSFKHKFSQLQILCFVHFVNISDILL